MFLKISGKIIMDKTCVLIPSYNVAGAIGPIIEDIRAQGLTVYVIDDGSTDGTASVADAAGAVVIKHAKNQGKGAALRDGFNEVLKKDFTGILVMDGDGQHEAAAINDFIKKMKDTGADIVIGNRMLNTYSMPLVRKITNRFMSYVLSKMCGQDLADTQCGFRLIKRNVLEGIMLESSNYEIESELLLKAAKKGFKIKSIPVNTVYKGESSKINPLVDTIRFIMFLIRTAVAR